MDASTFLPHLLTARIEGAVVVVDEQTTGFF